MADGILPHSSAGKNIVPEWISEYLPKELVESSLFRFKITTRVKEPDPKDSTKTRNRQIIVDLIPFLDLDYDILEEQMAHIPAQYAFLAALYSEARVNVALLERSVKVRRGEATRLAVEEGKALGVKLTADQVKVVIEADAEIVRIDTALQNTQMQVGKLFHMMEAVKMKSELARSLAGFKKQERSE